MCHIIVSLYAMDNIFSAYAQKIWKLPLHRRVYHCVAHSRRGSPFLQLNQLHGHYYASPTPSQALLPSKLFFSVLAWPEQRKEVALALVYTRVIQKVINLVACFFRSFTRMPYLQSRSSFKVITWNPITVKGMSKRILTFFKYFCYI